METSELIRFLFGLVALVGGAEMLVRGASRLAAALGISPLVIGLTVVAFGTSAPELAVSVRSAAAGQAELAVGNVVGSNVFNVLFILGIAALVAPLGVDRKLVRLDVPVMVAVSFATWWLAADGLVSRPEGVALFVGILVFVGFQLWESRREGLVRRGPPDADSPGGKTLLAAGVLAAVGLGLLVAGAHWLVDGAVSLARSIGVSERVIGLTLVAAGTSLPEVATSVVASWRGARDIAVGNVVGSNVFNLLAVLGAGAMVSGTGLVASAGNLRLDLPVMVAAAVACLPIFFTGFEIDRLEGGLFLLSWVGYTVLLYRGVDVSPWWTVGGFLALVAVLTVVQGRRKGE